MIPFRVRPFALVAAAMLLIFSGASASLTKAKSAPMEKNEPLIMENADRFEGNRSNGEYILSGKVIFTHGEMRIETDRAIWMKDKNQVYCESGMKITDRGSVLTSDRGNYDKNQGQAMAEGHVHMRDSTGEMEAFGKNIVYLRFKHLATLSGDPELRRYYHPEKDSAAKDSTRKISAGKDSTGKISAGQDSAKVAAKAPGRDSTALKDSASQAKHIQDSLAAKFADMPNHRGSASASHAATQAAEKRKEEAQAAKEKLDTLSIRGDVMTYDDSTQVAIADGNVRINREKLKITCKKAEYHDIADSLFLLGEPLVIVDDNQVKGQIMRLGMHGEEIKSLLVKGAAQAHSLEPATDTSAARQSNVQGDSLFLAFKEKAIDSVQVFKNANGTYFDVDKPEFVNKMSGDYMVLRFADKQIKSANVLGGAKSTYFHFEKKLLKGRNDAEGDTIDFAFKSGKVDEVMVKGQAKGTYFGEKPKKSEGNSQDTSAAKGAPGAKVYPASPSPSGNAAPAINAPATSVNPAPAAKGSVPPDKQPQSQQPAQPAPVQRPAPARPGTPAQQPAPAQPAPSRPSPQLWRKS